MADKPAIGSFCWNELMTKDAARAKQFYAALFGWQMTGMPIGAHEYTVLKQSGTDVGGLMQITPEMGAVPSHWMSYVLVEDVDAALKRAAELGAQVCVPGTDIANIGRFGVFSDPTGANLAVFQTAKPAAP